MFKFNTFSELVNGAIIQEDAHLAHKAEKKRKAPAMGSSSSAPQRFRLVQSGPQRAPFQHQPQQQWGYRPPQYTRPQGTVMPPIPQQSEQKVWGAAAGRTPQFVSVLQLWADGALFTELPDAPKAGPAVRSAEPEAECGSFQAGASALHHPRGYSGGSSSDDGYVLS